MYKLCFLLIVCVTSVWNAPAKSASSKGIGLNTCDCVCGTNNRRMRVVGGGEAKPHEFPWIAGIKMDGNYICGASLITRKHVLTAAHCITGSDVRKMKIILADHDRNAPGRHSVIVERRVRNARMHNAFEARTYNNDIAILELDHAVDFDAKIQPACLPLNANTNYTSRSGIIAGWGRVEEKKELSPVLKKLVVPVWSREQCLDAGYQAKKVTENMFCAGYPQGKQDACQGDSGGPLHVTNGAGDMEIIGLVSWGRGCARPNFPGLYTKVVNYLDWISESLAGECVCPPAQPLRRT
ncbi:uncharacterized protein CBL_07771 [Carabus blaptoides fortunei]